MTGLMPRSSTATSSAVAVDGYRYDLTRGLDPLLTFVMLNPSTADAHTDDPTIRRCLGFARREGFGGIRVANLYALRSTRPVHLWEHPDPVGPSGDLWLRDALEEARDKGTPVVCAWGANARADRVARFVELARAAAVDLHALGVTAAGMPRHPLYLRGDAPLVRWELPT